MQTPQYRPNNNYNTNTNSNNKPSFNFFNKSTKSQAVLTNRYNYKTNVNSNTNQPLVNDKNNVVVKQYNSLLNQMETYKMLNAYKETGKEKELIPHPKAKTIGYKNPFISQFQIK